MGEKEFMVDMSYQGYVFVGWAKGHFATQRGDKRTFYTLIVLSPASDFRSEDYQASGLKAEKKKCLSDRVWEGFEPGDRVRLFFDDKGRVIEAALED